MPLSLEKRAAEEEMMDDPAIDSGRFIGSLDGLRRVNVATRSAHIVWPLLRDTAATISDRPMRVLDVACGGGDTIVTLSRWAKRKGIALKIDGCDLSPLAVAHARNRAEEAGVNTHVFELDVAADSMPEGYDLIMCSLFLHHLSAADATRFLRSACSMAERAVVVHDLVRSRFGYWLAWFGTRALLCNDVCRHDGPLSVSKAFTLREMERIAEDAGVDGAQLSRKFPGRFLWVWNKAAKP
jgi:2-polyprenyl-3-methyl-5-hydroxy-6-metoxy-1,4-benzoquinol methylase